jgi:hypothetical protein
MSATSRICGAVIADRPSIVPDPKREFGTVRTTTVAVVGCRRERRAVS